MRVGMRLAILPGLLGSASWRRRKMRRPCRPSKHRHRPTQQGGANRAVLVAGDTAFHCRHGRAGWPGNLRHVRKADRQRRRRRSCRRRCPIRRARAAGARRRSWLPRMRGRTALRFFRAQGAILVGSECTAGSAWHRRRRRAASTRSQPGRFALCLRLGDGGEVDQYLLFATPAGTRRCAAGPAAARAVHRRTLRRRRQDRPTLCVGTGGRHLALRCGARRPRSCPTLIDAVRLGHITEEVGGLALYRRRRGRAMADRVQRLSRPDLRL